MLKVSIIGATGYAGAELLKILLNHPEVEVVHITSESSTGKKISELYPHLKNICEMELESMADIEKIGADSDFIFIALPHGHAMEVGKKLENLPVRIIDLGADYRFSDTSIYEQWYKVRTKMRQEFMDLQNFIAKKLKPQKLSVMQVALLLPQFLHLRRLSSII